MNKIFKRIIDWFTKPKIVIKDVDDSSTVTIKVNGKTIKN
jgi:hypothetical protein